MQQAFKRREKYKPDILHLSYISSWTLTFKRINLGNFHHLSEKYYNLQDNSELFLSWKCIYSFFIYMQTWILCQWRQWKCCSYKTKLYFSTWKFDCKHGSVIFCPGEWNHPVLNTSKINRTSLPQQAPYLFHSVLLLMWCNCYIHWTPLISQTQKLTVHLVEKKTSNWHMLMSWTSLSIIHLTELGC